MPSFCGEGRFMAKHYPVEAIETGPSLAGRMVALVR